MYDRFSNQVFLVLQVVQVGFDFRGGGTAGPDQQTTWLKLRHAACAGGIPVIFRSDQIGLSCELKTDPNSHPPFIITCPLDDAESHLLTVLPITCLPADQTSSSNYGIDTNPFASRGGGSSWWAST